MKAIETFMAASDPATLRKLVVVPKHTEEGIEGYGAILACGTTQGCSYHASGATPQEAIDNLDAELIRQAEAIVQKGKQK